MHFKMCDTCVHFFESIESPNFKYGMYLAVQPFIA